MMNGLGMGDILHLLRTSTIEIEGLLPWSSNYSFLVHLRGEEDGQPNQIITAVYKPSRGERPLWDFAAGTLCQREVAAFLISDALGWNLVPPTILRQGPHGLGSIQLYIEHDPECHYFTFEGSTDFRRTLQQITLFDILINNADRKGGHVLLQESDNSTHRDRLWAIDHGICFHSEYKLRTVIWEFAGSPIPAELVADLTQLKGKLNELYPELRLLLSSTEILALEKRLDRIIQWPTFIKPGPGRHYPWPPV